MLAFECIQCLIERMTNTPEQQGPKPENLSLADRLLRIRNAFTELALAQYSVGLQAYGTDEVEAAYLEARLAQRTSREALDKLDRDWKAPDGVIPEYVLKRTEWESSMNLENYLRGWVEPQRLKEIDEQFSEDETTE